MNDYYLYYGLTTLALLLTFGAQIYVQNVYAKYGNIRIMNGINGASVARDILDRNGLGAVQILKTGGILTDRYDPKNMQVVLSQNNFENPSIASVAVAAHECGHALQHKESYAFLNVRSALLPLVNISSYGGYLAIMLGAFLNMMNLIWIGIAMEIVILLFQVITLPVEFDASRRALVQIQENAYLTQEETAGAKKVLTAAALTYVAAVASTLLQILRLILSFGGRRERR